MIIDTCKKVSLGGCIRFMGFWKAVARKRMAQKILACTFMLAGGWVAQAH